LEDAVTDVSDMYADGFSLTAGPFGVTLTLTRSEPTGEAGQHQDPNAVVGRVRFSRELARVLADKNPAVLSATKQAYKYVKDMDFRQSEEYLKVKSDLLNTVDPERGRAKGMQQFLDSKTFRPGLGNYERDEAE